jgi:hypothetical protein
MQDGHAAVTITGVIRNITDHAVWPRRFGWPC